MTARPAQPSFAELFTPKLVTVLREGYGAADLRTDALAGLTVAIVAMPLSMAIAVASGVTPERGLYTAIVGGFIVSLLSGSRFQIGGPAGAFIVLVASAAERHGVEGLALATAIAGLILLAAGWLRLGTYIKYIPYPVTVGFTAGIAVIIASGQLKELLGLTLPGKEPGPFVPKIAALAQALPTINPYTAATAAGADRHHPPAAPLPPALARLPDRRRGRHPRGLAPRPAGRDHRHPLRRHPGGAAHAPPAAAQPRADRGRPARRARLRAARRHREPAVGRGRRQHVGPAAPLELRAGGPGCGQHRLGPHGRHPGHRHHRPHGHQRPHRRARPGLRHAARGFLLLATLAAAPLAGYIPLAALSGVLAVVAWNMAEKHEFAVLLRASRGDAVVLLATFLLTVFRDLTEGILAGFLIGTLLFMHRMAQAVAVESGAPPIEEDVADSAGGHERYDAGMATDPDVVVCRISGAFFFGAAATVASALDRLADQPKAYVLDVSAVPFLDSTAAATIAGFVRKARRRGAAVYVAGAKPPVRRLLLTHGLRPPELRFRSTLAEAVASAHGRPGPRGAAPVPVALTG